MFIGKVISLRKKTEKDLHEEYEIMKIRHDNWKNKTFEDYINFAKNWQIYDFGVSTISICYSLDSNEIEKIITNNYADINDGGLYDYAAIVEVPINAVYPETEIISIKLFKYDVTKNKYELTDAGSKETDFILKKLF